MRMRFLWGLAIAPFAFAEVAAQDRPLRLQCEKIVLEVDSRNWGDADLRDVGKVLASTADEFLACFPEPLPKPVIVRQDARGPQALYAKGPGGEYVVLLDTKDRRWAQMAYQFSHELFHVVSNYDVEGPAKDNPNQWLEEALGEAASLFTLERMAKTWRTDPPYPHWKGYASSLEEYAKGRLEDKRRNLPPDADFQDWFPENEPALRADPYLRERVAVIAAKLLPKFRERPERWASVRFLNLGPSGKDKTLREYLDDWHRHAPGNHKDFVKEVAGVFNQKL